MNELPKRKPNRLLGYDYSQNGAYFITICAKDHASLFSSIVGAAICRPNVLPNPNIRPQLTKVGAMIESAIAEIPSIYKSIVVDNHVIMPNHVHAIIINDGRDGRQVAAPTISRVIGHLKRIISMRICFSPWQKSFHDHIIRDEADYSRIAEYINNNPARWQEDCFYIEEDTPQ